MILAPLFRVVEMRNGDGKVKGKRTKRETNESLEKGQFFVSAQASEISAS